jgi:PAS domain S-box-containing protein
VVTAWNPAAERIFGFAAEEVIGRPLADVMQDPVPSREQDVLTLPGNGNALSDVKARLTAKNGRPVDVCLTTWPELGELGELTGTVTMVRELSSLNAPDHAASINLIYRKIVEALPDSLNVKDAQGRFMVANEATAALMKARSAAELIGKTDFDFYPKAVAEAFLRDERKILADGIPTVLEQEATWRDGKTVFLSTLKVPLRDETGVITGLITLNRDITQQRLLERRLANSQKYFADALAHLPDGLALFDSSGALVFCNQQYEDMFPRARGMEESGGNLDDILRAAAAGGEFMAAPPGQEDGSKPTGILRGLDTAEHQLADGRWIETRAKFTANGDCLLVCIDITGRKQAAKALQESERRYAQVADITQEAWWEKHFPSQRVKNSRRLCVMLGLGEEMIDCPLSDFIDRIHPDDQQPVQAAFDDSVRRDVDFAVNYRLRHADGHYIWVEDHGRILERDPDGNPVRLLGAMTDITARKRAEMALLESERNFRNLFDDAPDAYLILDPADGRALACNHATIRLLRGSEEQIIGKTPDQVSPPFQPDGRSSKDASAENIRDIMKAGYHRFEWMHRRFDGTDFWAEVTATVGTFQQRPVLFIIWREIGEIIAAKQAAEAASTAKSQFLSVMSHEFRTPLAAIMGMFQLIDMAGVNDQVRDYVARGLRSAEHLLKLVEDILDFSGIEAGRLALFNAPFLLGTLLEETGDATCGQRKPNVNFLIDADEAMMAMELSGDALRLKQVLINLLGNAFKFTDSGRVVLSARTVGGTPDVPLIEFAVEDSGIGLAPEQIDRLFQPFTQLDMRDARRFGGTGLGLVISKRLVSLMGGEPIAVRSEPGAGSRFSFRLALPLSGGSAQDNTPAPVVAPQGRLAGCRVLVVEDSATIRFAVRLLLQSEGASVEEAPDGAEGVKMAAGAAQPYDAVLMDMQIPLLDGIEATRELRRRGYTHPILALTANAFAHDLQACLAAGMNDYIAKPVKIDALVDVIRRNRRGPPAQDAPVA